MENLKKLFDKYREIVLYAVFGALTTVVNFASFWALEHIFGSDGKIYLFTNAAAWFISVVFAYVTNKLFVFESRSLKPSALLKEIFEFFGARVFSFLTEEGGLWLLVDVIGLKRYAFSVFGINITGQLISKAVLAVVVVVLNYIFSKFIVFKKKD